MIYAYPQWEPYTHYCFKIYSTDEQRPYRLEDAPSEWLEVMAKGRGEAAEEARTELGRRGNTQPQMQDVVMGGAK
jgi:hypothetical protein